MKSSHITTELEANILVIMRELKTIDLSDDEDEPSEEEEEAQINRVEITKAFLPRMNLSPKQENKQDLDRSNFPYVRFLGKLMILVGMSGTDVSCSV